METDGKVELLGPLHLSGKGLALLVEERFIPIEAETNFADSNIGLGVEEEFLLDDVEFGLKIVVDRSRVEAHHLAEILWILAGESLLIGMALAVDGREDHKVDPGLEGVEDSLMAVGVESLVV